MNAPGNLPEHGDSPEPALISASSVSPSGLPPGSVAAILPAAGSGQRFGDSANKLFSELGGVPMWVHSVEKLLRRPEVGRVILAVSATDQSTFERQRDRICQPERLQIVLGGRERSDSVWAALRSLRDASLFGSDSHVTDCVPADSAPFVAPGAVGRFEFVAIHDAARPLVRDLDLTAVFAKAGQAGAAILATPVTGTLKREPRPGGRLTTVDRRPMWVAATPQVFRLDWIVQAYRRHRGRPATDDAELIERSGRDVALVSGSADNLKITFPEDLLIAEALLQRDAVSHDPND